jgi:short-subunit dehydrogenase involved in D-alanine esterification of teichoic acids
LAAPRKLYNMVMGIGGSDAIPVDSATVSAVKLYSDSLRFYASRLNPAAYGEDKSAPVVNVTNNSLAIDGRTLDAGQREQLRALLTAAQHNHSNDSKLIDG